MEVSFDVLPYDLRAEWVVTGDLMLTSGQRSSSRHSTA